MVRQLMTKVNVKIKLSKFALNMISNSKKLTSYTDWEGDCRGDRSLELNIWLHSFPFQDDAAPI